MKTLRERLESTGLDVLYDQHIDDNITYTCVLGVYNVEFKHLYTSDDSILTFFYNNKIVYSTGGNINITISDLEKLNNKYSRFEKLLKDIIVFVDMDGVLADFYTLYLKMLEQEPEIKYPQSQWGFFRNLEPIKDAIDTYKWLNSVCRTHILTAPSYMNPLCYTEKRDWVGTYLGMDAANKMIICGYKNLCKGDYLVDDNYTGKGQDLFEGVLLHFHQETNNWKHIKDKLVNTHLNIFE